MPRLQLVTKTPPQYVERRGPDRNKVYTVRGLDMLWHTRRLGDGVTVAKSEDKCEAVNNARRLGYLV